MCGIVGYIGFRDAYPVLINGLHRLEYRGYDSAGVAIIDTDGDLNVYKAKGKVCGLEKYCSDKDISGTLGIAHTRWATHGEPNDINAHPQLSNSGKIAIVHNGTIENYGVLKEALKEKGCFFHSETDTEVLAELIEYVKNEENCTLLEAVRLALKQVIGAYAIAVIDVQSPDTIIAARKSSPLAIGIGNGETFLGSDASPIIEYTNKIAYLNDNEIAVISRNEPLLIINNDNIPSPVKIQELELNVSQLEKGGSGQPHQNP